MTPVTRRRRRDGAQVPARYRSVQPGAVMWLTLVWLILWGSLSWWNLLTGVVVAFVVCLVFPLPPLQMRLRIRPWAFVRLLVRFHLDVVIASINVARLTLSGREFRNSVIKVPLRSPSDFVLTVVAVLASLVPGSIAVEASRAEHTLYLHVLDSADLDAVEEARDRVWRQEELLVMAVGADIEYVEEAPEQ